MPYLNQFSISSAVVCLFLSCSPSDSFQSSAFVQESVDTEPRWRVDINRVRGGVFLPYRPRCTADIRIGHTVEFRNFQPGIPANVTGLSTPDGASLFSPNLVRPYNYIGPNDPSNDLCEVQVGSSCDLRPEWSFWRQTFETPGVYDWLDSNQSEPGRKVVDPYYGTETFVGIDPNSPFGTICIPAADGTGCEGICCASDSECTANTRCFKSESEAVGRCLTPSG